MENFRFKALSELNNRKTVRFVGTNKAVSTYFAENVFDRNKMQKYLTPEAFDAVIEAIDEGAKINRKFADQIASGMKSWAIERGVTHYTHWFHPLNESTAEKHDSFFEITKSGDCIENFRGELLIQQEPDASSFPSGGLRNTFEARGYTAWDPSSPAFIHDKTLCIPTVFVSFTGEALDFKAPLLKSLAILDKAASAVAQYFDRDVRHVFSTVGWEQEYFVVDEALYHARPDLMMTGRTLMGHEAARNQQLGDHYFGTIPERVATFMREFEEEAYRLGIPLKTRHNEVSPNQYECAPNFEEGNLAVDHNLLLMSIMKNIAKRHNLRVLFHEKPYMNVNGSGKHCNWSLASDQGVNLLSPGKTPRNNLQFLTFFICTICAVHEHGRLLMASVANLSNYQRLGAHEAPPPIMSVFIGETLQKVLNSLEEKILDKKMTPDEKTELKLDVMGKIPEIMPDATDRNRTSPFTFSGNRFEFRAVGSSSNCAASLLILNTAVAQQLNIFKTEVDKLIEKNVKKDEAILQILRTFIVKSKNILFDGNSYSEEWRKEAEKRELGIIDSITDAFKTYLNPKSIDLLTKSGVLSKRELESRYEIKNETFLKKLQIESRVLGDLALNHIIPTAIQYQNTLIKNVQGLKGLFGDQAGDMIIPQMRALEKISRHVKEINIKVYQMIDERKKANAIEDIIKRAEEYFRNVLPFLDNIRYHIDKLEMIVDDELWPMPKYRELLFFH
ncbi:MAG: glutamine synthetase III [Prevotellaceae bacterium]|jgi:glutamine synthetase|nr:glutamine synthetase III [Prevotellaceae bacterium]